MLETRIRRKRRRRPDVRYRPVKQSAPPKGIDGRTLTRYATPKEIELAKRALYDLEQEQNRILLVPAPEPNFTGHKIRVIESRNPKWYVEFGKMYWRGPRSFQLKRSRVVKALTRVAENGRVRGNGHEKELIEWLKQQEPGR
jgi:hypothetical protein